MYVYMSLLENVVIHCFFALNTQRSNEINKYLKYTKGH